MAPTPRPDHAASSPPPLTAEGALALADLLPVVVWARSAGGRLEFLSRHWSEYTGQPVAEALAGGAESLVHPDDRAIVRSAWARARDGEAEDGLSFECRLRRHDGTWRWHLVRGAAERDAEGRLVRWVGTGVDVEEQRQGLADRATEVERARLLAESEAARVATDTERQRLEAVLEQLPVGVVLAELPGGAIVHTNAATRRIWGIAAKTADVDGYSGDYVGYHPDTGRRYESHEWPLARAILHGETVTDELVDVEHPDGTRRLVSVSAAPLCDAEGRQTGGVVTSLDVTEREAALAALAASERQARTIAENATLALFIMDEHQRCTYMNPAAERLTGFTLDELQGQPLHYYIHHTRPDGSHYPLEECPIDQAFPQDMREQGTEVFVHKDGSFYPVAFTASPIRDAVTRAPTGTIIEVRDVREEQAAAAERERLLDAERAAREGAEEANRTKSQFLANMSHELRTPLNAIAGYVELIEIGIHGPVTEAQRTALARVQVAQRRLLGLINDILNFAKLESGRVEFDVEVVDVRRVVNEVVPLVEPQFAAHALALEVHLPDEPSLAWADREKLGQVLVNLLSNAAKFTQAHNPDTGAPGRVAIDVERDAAGDLRIRVRDTGIGIPADKLGAIFEPFVQVRAEYRRTTDGAGLGLAISRDLARGMGGELSVESVEGEGSTFVIALRGAVDGA